MARYNKLPRMLWTQGGLSRLPAPACVPATLYLYLLTCERPSCVPGLLRLGPGGIVDETGWDYEEVEASLADLARRQLVIIQRRPAAIFIPEAAMADLPEGPKQRKGWENALEEFPPGIASEAARRTMDGEPVDTLSDTPSKPIPEPHRFQEQEQEQEQEQIPPTPQGAEMPLLGFEPAGPKPKRSKPTKDQRVKAEAEALMDLWVDLSGFTGQRDNAAWKRRVSRFANYIREFSAAALARDLRLLAEDDWWRGRQQGGADRDIFRIGPEKFLNSPEKVEARLRRWEEEHGPAQPPADRAGPSGVPSHEPEIGPWDNPRPWTPQLRAKVAAIIERDGEFPITDETCWAEHGMGLEAYRWWHGRSPGEQASSALTPARVLGDRLHDITGAMLGGGQAEAAVWALVRLRARGLPLPEVGPFVEALNAALRPMRRALFDLEGLPDLPPVEVEQAEDVA